MSASKFPPLTKHHVTNRFNLPLTIVLDRVFPGIPVCC